MTQYGPIYCETGHPWLGMAEPVNTITNIFILLAAFLAYRRVRAAKIGMPVDIAILLLLLTATGIGSFLWHGLRQRWALQLDWMPGVLFLLVFAALWMRRLFGWIAGVVGAVLMIACAVGSVILAWRFNLLGHVSPNLRFTPAFGTITIFGLGLVLATAWKYGAAAAAQGALILACAMAAAVFRSIDLMMCALVPFGTHFLWHILLATAAYFGIAMLVEMRKQENLPSP
jgi:hypothetical protein